MFNYKAKRHEPMDTKDVKEEDIENTVAELLEAVIAGEARVWREPAAESAPAAASRRVSPDTRSDRALERLVVHRDAEQHLLGRSHFCRKLQHLLGVEAPAR